MTINLISPGVKITEADQVSSLQATGITIGGTAGKFRWGPMEQGFLITSETELAAKFGGPSDATAIDFLSAAAYLAYSKALYVVRSNATSANNATAGGTGVFVKNDDTYDVSFASGSETAKSWIAKYPGVMGNSLKVSTCPSAAAWQSQLTGSYTTTAGSKVVTVASGTANTQLTAGDMILLGSPARSLRVASVANATHLTLTVAAVETKTTATPTRRWEYSDAFDAAPGTSKYANDRDGVGDEMHIIVIDEDGAFSSNGNKGVVLEKFANVSKGSDAKTTQGASNFYRNIINNRSNYIRWGYTDDLGTNWGTTVDNKTFTAVAKPINYSLAGGLDGTTTDEFASIAFGLFVNKAKFPVSLIFTGSASATVVNSVIADVAEIRKDVVVTFSPTLAACQTTDGEAAAIVTFADTATRSTYAFMDGNWKYTYDKYNDVNVWIPCNADTAGAMARIDAVSAPWFSPAGYVNGAIRNVVKLAWNPDQEDRDTLYKYGINPIITEPGRGTILFGDKTMQTRPSAFDRINVRRLFIVLEKAVATASKFFLFEQNDAFTRATFKNLVVPFLKTVQQRRGITDFLVVCDDTNNTGEIIDRNEFVADIFIKPTRSINFIQLNFVATRTGVSFTEVAGA